MPLNLLSSYWWAMNSCFHSSLMMRSPCFKGMIVRTTHSIRKVVGFPHGRYFTYTVPPLPFYNISFQYFGSSCGQSVFNNLINLCFSEKSVITGYWFFFLDHFCVWQVGHIPVQIPKGLFLWPLSTTKPLFLSSLLPVTWSFKDSSAMAGYSFKES